MSVAGWKLPASWAWTKLGEVATVVGGGTPSTSDPNNFGGNIPWITPADMSTHVGKYISSGSRFISEKGLNDSGARWLPAGSVLFSSRAPIGYTAIAAQPVTTNQGFKSFVPHIGVNSDFLYYWLKSAKSIAEELASGTTFLELSGAKAALLPLPLAPTDEQTRIIAKLEELLSDLDAGVAELRAAQAKLAQYRQSLLKAAVEGALTADWRARHTLSETGAQLLARILAERRSRWESRQLARFQAQGKTPPKDWQSKYPEPAAPDTRDLPELPEGWVWASLDTIIDSGPQNGLYLPKERYGSGTPMLRIDDYQIGWHRSADELKMVQADTSTIETYALRPGDIVVNRVNSMTHLGKSLLIPTEFDGVLFESNMMRFRLSELLNCEFVTFYLGSEIGRSRLTANAKWAVNQASINQRDLGRTPIPIPPSAEQAAIADLVQAQLEACRSMANSVARSLKEAAAQRQNLLKAAFSGQLVPQDPADEPASALLERIRNGKTKTANQPTRRLRASVSA